MKRSYRDQIFLFLECKHFPSNILEMFGQHLELKHCVPPTVIKEGAKSFEMLVIFFIEARLTYNVILVPGMRHHDWTLVGITK